jgi:deoxyribodipyrimidine photo-lyase
MKSICWFRNDLRVLDNPALHHCCKNSDEVIAVYFINRAQWQEHDDALIKINFWLRNLELLQNKLKKINIPLVVLEADNYSETSSVLKDFCLKNEVKNLYFNNEYPINELERDRNIYSSFKEAGIGVFTYHDQVIHEPGSLKTTTGNNFSVYSPFKRKWFAELTESQLVILDEPEKQVSMCVEQTDLSKYLVEFAHPKSELWPAGEEFIQNYIDEFLKFKGTTYKVKRNFPAIDATAKLSPYINSGIVSSKWCLLKASEYNNGQLDDGNKGIVHWVSEILWREFYRHIIYNFPKVSKSLPFVDYTKNIPWNVNDEWLERWKAGKTGIPIVDAGIREMLETGWMHNRLRMIVAMFLSKNLLINWQEGEKFFMQHLVDGDIASNNGGWQWSASTGTDAAPYFRIMNPETQSIKFDPQGKYIKRWVPELADCSEAEVHMPTSPERYNYPKPLVDLKESRKNAIDVFSASKS